MSKKLFLWALVSPFALSLSTPANAGIDRIDFKYASIAHLGYAESVTTTPSTPKDSLELIANFLRSSGATVTKISEGDTRVFQTEGDKACEAWVQSIFRAEWAAFARNKLKEYKKINRTGSPAGCSVPKPSPIQYGYSAANSSDVESYTIEAIADRPANFNQSGVRPSFGSIFNGFNIASVISMVPTQSSYSVNFQTSLIVHIWRDSKEATTSVFVIGIPMSDGVKASPGMSIGSLYRPFADGQIEKRAAENILSFVAQNAIMAK
jgi:hypothetical protein